MKYYIQYYIPLFQILYSLKFDDILTLPMEINVKGSHVPDNAIDPAMFDIVRCIYWKM